MKDSKPENIKLDVTLTPPSLVRSCARAFESGIKKGYSRGSYLNGDISNYKSSLYRHVLEYLEGHTVDEESGLDILDHIVANVAILIELENKNK